MWLTRRSDGEAAPPVEVVGERFVVGRDEGCDLVLEDERVSRRHAYLRAHPDGRAELHDLGSANGTFVNGRRVRELRLRDGDEIALGNSRLIFHSGEGTQPPTSPGVTVVANAQSIPAFLAQLEQFSSLEQLQEIKGDIAALRSFFESAIADGSTPAAGGV